MCRAMRYRGPDDTGYLDREFLQLGHVRLSIIDLSGGKQPVSNEDGSVNVVFGGEIYNYQELKEDLRTCGHLFKTKTDTEVLVHAYEEYGRDFLNKIIGEFAFCIWDDRNKYFVLARDRLGVKPVYYADINGRLIFSSELNSLMEAGGIPKELDQTAIKSYFDLKSIPAR